MLKGSMQGVPVLISDIIKHAEVKYPQVEVISRQLDKSVKRSNWREVALNARKTAQGLEKIGIAQGDRVGTLAWNNTNHLEAYFAISGMGAVLHTINPRLFPQQLVYIINHAKDRLLFIDESFIELVNSIKSELTSVENIIVLSDTLPHGCEGWICYKDWRDAEDGDYTWPQLSEDSAAALCYTSGTTGNPKGVLYSHRSTMLHTWAFATADCLGLSESDTVLPVVPMFHVNAWGVPYATAMMGSTLVLPGPHLDGENIYDLIQSNEANVLLGVPTVWLGLLNYLREIKAVLHSVEKVIVGGSAVPLAMIKEFDETHGAWLLHVWGMTELSPVGTTNIQTAAVKKLPPEERHQLQTKQGKVVFGIEMRIADDDGNTLPHDGKTFGRLMVRGPWVLERYYLAENSAVDADGWFDTGDVSTIDPDGYMQIVDRAKDVIKSGGEWISSIDLENSAVNHPKVNEACVIGVPHPKWDERPLLLVVPSAEDLTKEEVLEFLSDKVAKWWLPDDVIFVEELPHTATGKLLKVNLREEYSNHLTGSGPSN